MVQIGGTQHLGQRGGDLGVPSSHCSLVELSGEADTPVLGLLLWCGRSTGQRSRTTERGLGGAPAELRLQ